MLGANYNVLNFLLFTQLKISFCTNRISSQYRCRFVENSINTSSLIKHFLPIIHYRTNFITKKNYKIFHTKLILQKNCTITKAITSSSFSLLFIPKHNLRVHTVEYINPNPTIYKYTDNINQSIEIKSIMIWKREFAFIRN